MKLKLIVLSFILMACLIHPYGQKNYTNNNLRWEMVMPELMKKTNIGIFIKGESHEVQHLCKQHKASYIKRNKEWHYIRIKPLEIEAFINSPLISSYHIPLEEGTPLNDTMRVNNRINDIHNGISPLSTGYTGKNVIIGFIDTGLDYNHNDFKNADGTTRIISLWDQTLSNAANTPQPYGYGQHWNSNEIEADLASSHNDIYGHGTTVTGTAAGNGLASSKHKGVAFEADIIAVEVDFGANFLTNVQDATEYIYHIADSLGLPCVINASAGTYFGSHDGYDPSAQYIDGLITSSNGHLFVCSAGNKGGSKFHLQHNSNNNDTIFSLFKNNENLDYSSYGCVPYCYGDNSVHFTAYADKSIFSNVKIAMSAYHENKQSGISNYFTISDYLEGSLYQDNYGAYVDSIVNDNNERVGLQFVFATLLYDSVYEFEIIISPDSTENYLWGFHTTGNGKCDIWSDENTYNKSKVISSNDSEFPFLIAPTNYIDPDTLSTMCSSFQCLPSVITVGNYINETGYINNLGNWVNRGGERGRIANSSSTGPTRTGLIKPDITASGKTTVSSYPNYLLGYRTDEELGEGGLHYINGGTSMSSPVVAGIAALYLEKCNQANYQNFKTDLINNAYTDAFTGSIPNFSFGYGKLDGFQTLIASGIVDTVEAISCNNYEWNSSTYNTTGYYSYSSVNSRNCDSTIILDLTIFNDTSSIDTIYSCDPYTWIDGVVYSSNNNIATHELATISGCDSVVKLNLTISESYSTDTFATVCDSLFWYGSNYISTGSYLHNLQSISGCDSIINLNLITNSSSNVVDTKVACDTFTWTNGVVYNSSNNTAFQTLTNTNGCDSVISLDLTITNSKKDTTFMTGCDSLEWNNQLIFQTGLYVDSNQTVAGCDSISYLNLTLNNSYNDTINMVVCDTFLWNNNYYTSSGFISNSFSSINNCDSIVTVNLEVNNTTVTPITLQLILDDYCLENSWLIKDSHDSIWQQDGPFNCNPNGGGQQANDTIFTDIYLPSNECFSFILNDIYGDGMSASNWGGSDGSWELKDFNGEVISQGEGNFGYNMEVQFVVDSVAISNIDNNPAIVKNIKAYPNPFSESTKINIKNINLPITYKVYDFQGRLLIQKETYENPFSIYKNDLSNGIYWLEILNETKIKPLKIILH